MKNKSKLLITLIAIFICCIMALFISACQDGNNNGDGNTDDNTDDDTEEFIDFGFKLNEDGDSYSVINYAGSSAEVVIPDTYKNLPVTSIGRHAFYECTSLTKITIPDSVTSIGEFAFSHCTSLESVEISENITIIDNGAFIDCTSLTAVKITDIISWCGIKFENGDSNPLHFAHNLYLNDELVTALEIPDSVTSISWSFYGCTSLESVSFGDNSQLTSIGDYAFYCCTSLTSITFGNNSKLTSIGYCAFIDCTSLKGIIIPDGVTFIDRNAFSGCESFESIAIPDGVTSLCEAFVYCTNLKSVTFGVNSKLTSIDDLTFYNCTSLESIEIPDGVTSIGREAFFGCTNLKSVSFGENSKLTTICGIAFLDCTSLESVVIPASVTYIEFRAFSSCTSLTAVKITDIASWCNIKFEDFEANPLFYAHNLYLNDDLVTALEIPDSVVSIEYSFCDCESLESVSFSDTSKLTSIGNYTFYRCTNLKSISFGNNSKLISIGFGAFFDCESLESITIPDSVTTVGAAFAGCESLKSVIFKNTNGWTVGDTSIENSILEDPVTAATYLKSAYLGSTWTRS